jgi:hypothetical protein
VRGVFQFAPTLFRTLRQLEDHRQDASPRDTAARLRGPQVFSGRDMRAANADGVREFIATPSRRIRVYDPATGRTTTLPRRTL